MNNLKTTIAAGLYFVSVVLKNIGVDIPANILTDFQAVIIFALGFFAQDSTEKKPAAETPKEEVKK